MPPIIYYNVSRTHRSLNKDAPLHRAIERLGAVVSRPVLGGLHHQYCRTYFSAHKGLPKKEAALPEWQAAIEALMLVADRG